MTANIYLTFSKMDGTDPHEFKWNLCDTSLAKRWLEEIVISLINPDSLREQRFNGWASTPADQEKRVKLLNNAITTINSYYGSRYHIKERASVHMSQDNLNALHHHFELLIGQSWNPSEFIKDIPPDVFKAIRVLNDLVHDYEAADRVMQMTADGHDVDRCLHFQMTPYRQLELTKEDLETFDYSYEFGDMWSNYCQLGKTWVEVFHDKDVHIHPENIAPLRYYAATFGCYFSDCPKEKADAIKTGVLKFIAERSQATGIPINPHDVRNALGHSVYAKLDPESPLRKMGKEECVEFIRTHSNIKEMRIVRNHEEMKRSFPSSKNYYE